MNNSPDSLDQYLRQAATLCAPLQIETIWLTQEPSPLVIASAWQMLTTINAALQGLSAGLQTIKLIETNMGRIRCNYGVLEASFTPGIPPATVQELQPLLAAIL